MGGREKGLAGFVRTELQKANAADCCGGKKLAWKMGVITHDHTLPAACSINLKCPHTPTWAGDEGLVAQRCGFRALITM